MPSCRHHHGHSRWLGHVHKLRPGFLSGTNAAFIGSGSASQGVYQCHPGDPCRLVADTGTAIPSGGLFTGFDQPWVSGTTTAFLGFGSSGTTGVDVCHPSDPCQPVATTSAAIPAGSGAFNTFTAVAVDGTSTAFCCWQQHDRMLD